VTVTWDTPLSDPEDEPRRLKKFELAGAFAALAQRVAASGTQATICVDHEAVAIIIDSGHSGLPGDVREAAAEVARDRKLPTNWLNQLITFFYAKNNRPYRGSGEMAAPGLTVRWGSSWKVLAYRLFAVAYQGEPFNDQLRWLIAEVFDDDYNDLREFRIRRFVDVYDKCFPNSPLPPHMWFEIGVIVEEALPSGGVY
jgi:hypothetical protein